MRTTHTVLLLTTLLIATAAAARACDPYQFWAGPAYVSDSYYYSPDYVPYFIRNPPVYNGYSMLLPLGEGFTMRSYSPDAVQLSSPPKPPLLLVNPYVKATVAPKDSRPKPVPKPVPKAKKASLQLTSLVAPVRNPFVTP